MSARNDFAHIAFLHCFRQSIIKSPARLYDCFGQPNDALRRGTKMRRPSALLSDSNIENRPSGFAASGIKRGLLNVRQFFQTVLCFFTRLGYEVAFFYLESLARTLFRHGA